ncbi:MAG: hypothetical protein KJP17_06570 [Gammaproteobacteria bacterium]|nr:hypothetical protein [Gammaproteobacteria bacterium]
MSEQEKISPLIRVASGVIGVLGFAAIPINAANDGGLQLTVITFASFWAGFIFLFVSFFGKYPWDRSKAEDSDE